ncbi:MAG: alpha/beta fold hydrolase [Eggerthellaceae bacterium]|nr:alpha/beta fold hydrolase [Eggerthellaceae bacterium]
MTEQVREEFSFTSADGKTPIHAITWLPKGEAVQQPRGIVQLAHGMEEYIARYDDFARFLTSHGFAVCGNDHIGHGLSVSDEVPLSHLPLNGATVMLADMNSLRAQFASCFPENTPYILFGHSMGSFAARCYLARYGKGLAGAIICGTGDVPVAASIFGGFLARRMAEKNGLDSYSPFITSLSDGKYGKAIPVARTNFDWLNTDPAQVDAYINDPLCGVAFTVGGYASLMDLVAEACSTSCTQQAPAGLPVLFISGEDDPVGGHDAKGAMKAFERYAKHSKTLPTIKIYPGMRHEILNEPEHQTVYDDVLAWLDKVVGSEQTEAT